MQLILIINLLVVECESQCNYLSDFTFSRLYKSNQYAKYDTIIYFKAFV